MSDHLRGYLDWPYEISIETFSKCNAACVFCPYPTLERQGAKMSDAMLDRIIDELKDHPHGFIVSPFKVNEPFLDKRLLPLCRKINAELPNAHIRLFSNGSALTQKHLEEVAQLSQVFHLWISLNDHRSDEYKRIMGLDFERTAKNLDRLHGMVKAQEFPHEVVVSRVADDEGNAEFLAYCRNRWPAFDAKLIKRDSWLGFIEGNDRPVPDAPCQRWWELNITATGKVALCCMDGEAKYAIGDLNEQSLFEVYNGKQWRAQRVKRMSRLETGTVCATCNY